MALYLVTGGAGFIGSNLVEALLRDGHDVRALDDLSSGRRENLADGFKPVFITNLRGLGAAEVLADNKGLGERVDILEIEQFLATGVYELGGFTEEGRRKALRELVDRYNAIVESVEQQKVRQSEHLGELDTLLAALQQRAFNGELFA